MCGVVGIWELDGRVDGLQQSVSRMSDTLAHRGPDDSGVWLDEKAGLALGFRRLAIIDVSPLGHQPMRSASGRYVIAFNGEVYNFQILQAELRGLGHTFRGHSDTEVILAAVEQWGVVEAVRRFVGMFAIVLWDTETRTLSLIRDRVGIKPLYYALAGRTFLCASELKAIRAYAGFDAKVDRDALALFVRHMYVPAPYSIYQGVFKLPPGTILQVGVEGVKSDPVAYWSAREVANWGTAHPLHLSEAEAIEQLDVLLREAVRLRMIADVPLGAFLSGGIDSSVIVALMQAQATGAVKTFSIGFNESDYNEAQHAKAVAKHLGTDHTELYVTPAETQAVIPRLPEIFDEPFADSSQIPTFVLSQLTRRFVTVSLSGDGGDELFCGYPRFLTNAMRWRLWRLLPPPVRRCVGRGLTALGSSCEKHSTLRLCRRLSTRLRLEGRLLCAGRFRDMYRCYLSQVESPTDVVLNGMEPRYGLSDDGPKEMSWSAMEEMMYLDQVNYLPDDILPKVDRTSMAVSLEARVPFLDHRVVEFAWRLPLSYKARHRQGKWILRQVLDRYVPRELVDRPKMGFAVPIGQWVRGPLRDWAESLLDERRMREDGYLNAPLVRSWWAAHLGGKPGYDSRLWIAMMFQAWKERWLN
jgi:asparagine synthase (glutamine-hydrolysing)